MTEHAACDPYGRPVAPSTPATDTFHSLRRQFLELARMMDAVRDQPTSPFRSYMFLYAARLFFRLGQLEESISLTDKAREYLPPDHPFFVDCQADRQRYVTELAHATEFLRQSHDLRIYLFTDTGLPLFTYQPHPQIESALVGGLFCAIQSFCSNVTAKPLTGIVIDHELYYYYHRPELKLFAVALAPVIRGEIALCRMLDAVVDRFASTYRDQLAGFDGQMGQFAGFTVLPAELALLGIPDI